MTTKEELIRIHDRYKQNVNDFTNLDNKYNAYLREYDKVKYIECQTVESLKLKICETLAQRLKFLDSYMSDEHILQVARDEHTDEYYKMCFTYTRIGFLTKQDYDTLTQADYDIDSITIETCMYLQKLIQDNYAAYYIASASLPGRLRMRLDSRSKKTSRWF